MKYDAHEVATELRPQVNAVLAATAYARLERERVDEICRRVLGNGGFSRSDPKFAWEMGDEEYKRYAAKRDAALRDAGYRNLEPGHCPALIAEELQRKAERALIDEAERRFFPGITTDRLLLGVKGKDGLTLRREWLDLLIKIVVNAPGYKSPLAA